MNWKYWLKNMCPSDWTDEQALEFVNLDCPEVTLERLQEVRYALAA